MEYLTAPHRHPPVTLAIIASHYVVRGDHGDGRASVKSVPDVRDTDMTRPLLVVDGDSFAHRAYHALPKSIRRIGDRGGGAIVGFANILLRLYEAETPRAVLVGWDTLGAPTYRQRLFPDYQSGRVFDEELVDQLEVL